MADSNVRQVLDRLDAESGFSVARIDEGPALKSHIAVLPASFNPPTIAHVELLEQAKGVSGVATSVALLTTRNVDKSLSGASYEDRIAMLLALDLPSTGIFVSNAARIADQAVALRNDFPTEIFDFVVGYDTLVRLFDRSYYHEELAAVLDNYFSHHRVIAATRGEQGLDAIDAFLNSEPTARDFVSRILPLDLGDELADVSSTEVRETIATGGDPDVPPSVRRYIDERGLYSQRA